MMSVQNLPPGTVFDKGDSSTYEFPAQNLEVDKIVASVQAELRAAGAALGLAEFMVSGDASNANYNSTMVAEGPPVKMFERWQTALTEEDIEVQTLALRIAEREGRIPRGIVDKIKITAEPPILISRNRLQEKQADQILVNAKAMSVETMAARSGASIEYARRAAESEARVTRRIEAIEHLLGATAQSDA